MGTTFTSYHISLVNETWLLSSDIVPKLKTLVELLEVYPYQFISVLWKITSDNLQSPGWLPSILVAWCVTTHKATHKLRPNAVVWIIGISEFWVALSFVNSSGSCLCANHCTTPRRKATICILFSCLNGLHLYDMQPSLSLHSYSLMLLLQNCWTSFISASIWPDVQRWQKYIYISYQSNWYCCFPWWSVF